MSRKTSHSYAVFNAVDATTNQTSEPTHVGSADKVSYHIKFSANNSGEFFVEAKNSTDDSWFEVTFNADLDITADNEAIFYLNECPFEQLRLRWVPSAGSGTLTTFLKMKSLGN